MSENIKCQACGQVLLEAYSDYRLAIAKPTPEEVEGWWAHGEPVFCAARRAFQSEEEGSTFLGVEVDQ